MNARLLYALLGGVLIAVGGARLPAVTAELPPDSDWTPPVAVKRVDPLHPAILRNEGVDGKATVIFLVSAEGLPEDVTVFSATHREFGESLARAIAQWRFKPATFAGEPVAARVRLLAHFSLQGAVLSLSASDHLALHIRRLSPDDHLSYRVSHIRDLDEIPRTVQTVMPVLHPDAPRVTEVKHVRIDFILAPDGTVRVPAIQSADDGWRAAAAIDALRQWHYTPPTVKGKPVYANLVQVITFQPN